MSGRKDNTCDVPLNRLLAEVNVMLMTPQILLNILRDGTISFSSFSLLIIDECHRTHDNHPYNEIMALYRQQKLQPWDATDEQPLPQVIIQDLHLSERILRSILTSNIVLSHMLLIIFTLLTLVIHYHQGLTFKACPVAHGHHIFSMGHYLSSITGPKRPVDFQILRILYWVNNKNFSLGLLPNVTIGPKGLLNNHA